MKNAITVVVPVITGTLPWVSFGWIIQIWWFVKENERVTLVIGKGTASCGGSCFRFQNREFIINDFRGYYQQICIKGASNSSIYTGMFHRTFCLEPRYFNSLLAAFSFSWITMVGKQPTSICNSQIETLACLHFLAASVTSQSQLRCLIMRNKAKGKIKLTDV